MLASLLSGTDSATINKLFASQSTPVNEILDRSDVAAYLRQLTDSTKIPKNVLAFVERHMPKLLLAAQQRSVVSTNSSFSSSTSTGAFGKEVNGRFGRGKAAAASAGDGRGRAGDDANANGNGERRRGSGKAASSAGASEGREPDKAAPSTAAVVGTVADGAEDNDGVAPELTAQQLSNLALRSANATSLLFLYLSSPDCSSQAIEQVVPVSLAALAHPGAFNPAVSLCVQRLLLAAFDSDFTKTTEVIATTLDEDIVHGTIENLSRSSVVTETLIALFGSALSASFMMAPSTKTESFTSAWIHYRFVDLFCAEMPSVIGRRCCYNYFYFFREVLKRGFSHTAGPIADLLLRQEYFVPMLETIITTCEDDARLPVPSETSDNSSLSPEAMAVMSLIVNLLRKSLILPETAEMYFTTTDYIATLRAVRQQKDRLVRLLQYDSTSGAALVRRNTIGLTRLSVCEIFVELSLYQLSSTDTVVVESGFMQAFLQLCAAYPEHDSLARLLHKCVVDVFTRPPLLGETLNDAKDRDILVRHLVESEEAFGRSERGDCPMAAGALFSSLFYFATAARTHYTPMATFSIDAFMVLNAKPYFSGEPKGPLRHLLDPFREHEGVTERVQGMQNPITGGWFSARGSAQTPLVAHRPVINLVGNRFQDKRGLSSASNGDAAAGSPTSAGAATHHPLSSYRAPLPSPSPSPSGGGGGGGGSTAGPVAGNDTSNSSKLTLSNDGEHAGSSRGSFSSGGSDDGGGPVTEEPPDGEVVEVDLEAISEEVNQLRAASSPQIQAYPSFRSMHIGFGAQSPSNGDEGREEGEQDVLLAEMLCELETHVNTHQPNPKLGARAGEGEGEEKPANAAEASPTATATGHDSGNSNGTRDDDGDGDNASPVVFPSTGVEGGGDMVKDEGGESGVVGVAAASGS